MHPFSLRFTKLEADVSISRKKLHFSNSHLYLEFNKKLELLHTNAKICWFVELEGQTASCTVISLKLFILLEKVAS